MENKNLFFYLVLNLASLLSLTSCDQKNSKQAEIIVLKNSLQPLKDYFNNQKGKIKLLAILLPISPYCRDGAAGIRKFLEKHPDIDVSISIVWTSTFKKFEEAKKEARLFTDPRVKNFYDYNEIASKTFGKIQNMLHASALYMFFSKGCSWGKQPPAPNDYIDRFNKSYFSNEFYNKLEVLLKNK